MDSLRFAIAALLLPLLTISAQAAPIEKINVGLRNVIDTVETSFKPAQATGLPPLSDVSADFFQRSTLAEKKREMRADGQMFFRTATARDPLKFRFDYFRPTAQEIVSDGKTLWVYLPANRQVILSDVSFVFNPFNFDPDHTRAVNFLQGLGRISKDFVIFFSPQGQDIEGNYILELTPRRAMATIEKLFIVVNRDAVLNHVDPKRPFRQEFLFPILSTTVVDHQGNTTIMEFSNIRTNTRVSEALFDFQVPPYAQVVRPPTGR
ncbi:MAG: Outer membrane lipoprotein carrier protein [Geobacteraceae bacterium]|nr:MAG: Outer membrane lipoprotein carrier protein [Geobacteraceae bacterium]